MSALRTARAVRDKSGPPPPLVGRLGADPQLASHLLAISSKISVSVSIHALDHYVHRPTVRCNSLLHST